MAGGNARITAAQALSCAWLGTAVLLCAWAAIFKDAPSQALSRAIESGFDAYGRPLWLVVPRAALRSAAFASAAAVIATATGLALGAALALTPARIQRVLERALEGLLAFPYLVFALAIAVVRGPGWGTLLGTLLIGTVPTMIRLVHVRSRELLHEEFVTASAAMGAGSAHILSRHLTPAAFSLCLVKLPNLFASALMAEASLSFLGIGAPTGEDTWGSLLAQGKDYLLEAPHIALDSGLPLLLTVLSLQILSERFERNRLS